MSKERLSSILAISLIALVLAIAAFLLLFKLSAQPFQDDEALYAEVSTESLSSQHFLSFTYRDASYFNKPPILFWLLDIDHSLISDAQEAERLPSAIAGVLLVGAVMLLVYEGTRSLYATALGGLILATTASFAMLTRAVRFDSLVSLWIVLSVYAFMRAFENKKWFLWFGAFIGVAVLTKGPVAIFAIFAVLGMAAASRNFKWLRDPYFWGGVGIALLIAVPWHLYETVLFGWQFWQVYVGQQLVSRVQENLLGVPITNAQYFWYLFEYAAPWSTVFLLSLVPIPFLWKRMSQKARALLLASLTGVFSILAVYFLMVSKTYRYLLPLYPFMAVSIALVAFEISCLKIPHIKKFFAGLFCVLGVYAFLWTAYNGFYLNPNYPYYTNDPRFLAEEKAIGEMLITQRASNFYVYDTVRIRPIIFYSQLIHPYNIPLSHFLGALYITMPTTSLSQFEEVYPYIHLTLIYKGEFMILAIGRDISVP